MSYATREGERYEGQPVEAFRFVQGENSWLYTSADVEITLPIGTFTPESISRTAVDHSREDSGEKMEFTVGVDNPVAVLFIGNVPSSPVWVTAYRAHRGDEMSPVTMYTGRISHARFDETEAILVGTSTAAMMTRHIPVMKIQTPCNHVVYSEGCGVDPTSHRESVTVTTVDGSSVTSSDFALQVDGWFAGGRLQSPEGEGRFIVEHVGDTVTLLSPMPGLASLDVVWAYWGCDHLEATCVSKFSNLDNYLGWSRLPNRNPFRSRID